MILHLSKDKTIKSHDVQYAGHRNLFPQDPHFIGGT